MLRPQDNSRREAKRLDGIWDFALDPQGVGRHTGWWRRRLPTAGLMPVPCSYNDVWIDPAIRDHVGDAWYQRSVVVPRGWDDQRILLRFDAATHRRTAWVDETEVASHEGGYTPFEADISTFVQPGSEFRLPVVVKNELTWTSIPPGVVEVQADGASATTTTSSTTPACIGASGCPRRPSITLRT